MKLSDHFTLEEFTATQVRGVDNTPSDEIVERFRVTAGKMEAIRALLGTPIIVTSGYRSAEVNRIIGGVPGSAHTLGYAVDFISPDFGSPFDVAVKIRDDTGVLNGTKFDQLIREYGWVHISFDPQMRNETLTKTSASAPYQPGLVA